jgi:cytochrome c-type biogenesis protein CcmH
VRNALARIDEKGPSAAVAPPQHPTAAVAPPEHNGGAIEAMVERLAERLKKDGSGVPGWIQLARSYRVLGKADKVKAAIADARAALATDQDALRRLDQGRHRPQQASPLKDWTRARSPPPRKWRRPSGME